MLEEKKIDEDGLAAMMVNKTFSGYQVIQFMLLVVELTLVCVAIGFGIGAEMLGVPLDNTRIGFWTLLVGYGAGELSTYLHVMEKRQKESLNENPGV